MCEYIDDRAEVRSTAAAAFTEFPRRDRRPIRVLIIGQRQDVVETIKNLHSRGFAPADEWSRPAPWSPTETPPQAQLFTLPKTSVMSVCTRYLE
jgi:hypothetical protein